MATTVSVLVLAAVLGFAVARPRRLAEAVLAVPAAVVVVVTGLVPWRQAWSETVLLAPTVGFLAAVLALSFLADAYGVFRYAASVAARWSHGSPPRLLTAVFAVAAVVTAVLSLDATVVLLTPAVLGAAAALAMRPQPHAYACTHLANSASLLLPVSNLTNLVAFRATGLSFLGFAALMLAPWLVVILIEYAVFRRFFTADLVRPRQPRTPPAVPAPRFALSVLAVTFAGLAAAQSLGVSPAWVAVSGALVLTVPMLRRAPARTAAALVRAANPAFCAFVFGLGVVVLAVRDSDVGDAVGRLLPGRADLPGLLVTAVVAAVLANLVNNLPATLMLVPLASHSPALVMAVLLGVNIGPNLTYVGSLATLLWRRILHSRDQPPSSAQFLRLGLLTVPGCLTAAVVALWGGLVVSGML